MVDSYVWSYPGSTPGWIAAGFCAVGLVPGLVPVEGRLLLAAGSFIHSNEGRYATLGAEETGVGSGLECCAGCGVGLEPRFVAVGRRLLLAGVAPGHTFESESSSSSQTELSDSSLSGPRIAKRDVSGFASGDF